MVLVIPLLLSVALTGVWLHSLSRDNCDSYPGQSIEAPTSSHSATLVNHTNSSVAICTGEPIDPFGFPFGNIYCAWYFMEIYNFDGGDATPLDGCELNHTIPNW